jgi:predicted enzyme related to lactoylglutathione lyase
MEFRVVRITDRFDDVCRFYGRALGWPVTRQWDDGGRGRIFGFGADGRIEVIEGAAEQLSGVFLSIEVDDADAFHDRLVAADVTITQRLGDQPWGHRNFAVIDPEGLQLVFFHWLPGVARAG